MSVDIAGGLAEIYGPRVEYWMQVLGGDQPELLRDIINR